MKIKTATVQIDGKDVVVALLDDKGLPLYTHEDGKEVGFDATAATAKITQLNGEAMGHRQAKEVAEAIAKKFEGIEDPEAAKNALATVANLDQGKLIEAGKVQEIKDAAAQAAREQVAAAIAAGEAKNKELEGNLESVTTAFHNELIGGGFSRSKYIADKLILPPDVAQAYFGKNFKIEDNKPVGYYPDGTKMFSRERPGEVATVDEALEIMVSGYPAKDSILKGEMKPGGGAGNGGGGGGDGKTITRTEFDKLDPVRAGEVARTHKIVDAA